MIQIFGMGLIMAGIFGLNRLMPRPLNEERSLLLKTEKLKAFKK